MKYLKWSTLIFALTAFLNLNALASISNNEKQNSKVSIDKKWSINFNLSFESETKHFRKKTGIKMPELFDWSIPPLFSFRQAHPYSIRSFDHSNDIPFAGISLQKNHSKHFNTKTGFQYGYVSRAIYQYFDETKNIGKRTYSSFAFTNDIMFSYIIKSKFEVYALLGIALIHSNEKNHFNENRLINKNFSELTYITNEYSEFFLLHQVSPIAIRYGGDLAVTAEIGTGYRGLVNIGISKKIK